MFITKNEKISPDLNQDPLKVQSIGCKEEKCSFGTQWIALTEMIPDIDISELVRYKNLKQLYFL